ncbi:hypothetical protein LDO31_18975 [Luteimonas sp. XNQY3]|nr:hypothetical protein [Luteimonas sp. XNQY3]MCD9008273.1 hypothetical protein [Luteimonas sp. XNQY3]
MTAQSRYRLSFHVSHPGLPADAIAAHFALPVRYARSVGQARVTKAGRSLGGIYATTEISFDISNGVISAEQTPLADLLQYSFGQLPLNVIRDLVQTKGECFFLAGVYTEENMLVYFPGDSIAALASASIGLKLDFYGGEE